MRDYLEVGPTPADETCAQVGELDYEERAQAECQRFIDLIRKTVGPEPAKARLVVHGMNHDFGIYYEVAVRYDTEDEESWDYALKVESEAPTRWEKDPGGMAMVDWRKKKT